MKENYKSVEELGNFVLEDLRQIISQDCPDISEISPVDMEYDRHRKFTIAACALHYQREKYLSRLSEFVGSTATSLLVSGDLGCGKKILL